METTSSLAEPMQESSQGLPPELRDMAYENMVPMLDDHVSAYRGMFLASGPLHDEWEAVVAKKIREYMSSITEAWNKAYGTDLRISVSAYRDVNVSIPLSFIRAIGEGDDEEDDEDDEEDDDADVNRNIKKGRSDGGFPSVLLPLIPLHISCLTFSFYEDEEGKDPPDTMEHAKFGKNMYRMMEGKLMVTTGKGPATVFPNPLATDRLRIEWAPDDWTFYSALAPLCFCIERLKEDSWYEASRTWGNEGNDYGPVTPERDACDWVTSQLTWDRLVGVTYDEEGKIVERRFAKDQH